MRGRPPCGGRHRWIERGLAHAVQQPGRHKIAGDWIELADADLAVARLLELLVPVGLRLVDVGDAGLLVDMVDAERHGGPPCIATIVACFGRQVDCFRHPNPYDYDNWSKPSYKTIGKLGYIERS